MQLQSGDEARGRPARRVGVCPDVRGEATEISGDGAVSARCCCQRLRPAHRRRRVRDFGLRGRAERLRRGRPHFLPLPRPAPPERREMAACRQGEVEVRRENGHERIAQLTCMIRILFKTSLCCVKVKMWYINQSPGEMHSSVWIDK